MGSAVGEKLTASERRALTKVRKGIALTDVIDDSSALVADFGSFSAIECS